MEQEEILEAVKLILARYIKENRMRNTPERNAILELFYKKGGMHSADEVYDIMTINVSLFKHGQPLLG